MDFISSINEALKYIEKNITEDLSPEEISKHIYLSSFHFQKMVRVSKVSFAVFHTSYSGR